MVFQSVTEDEYIIEVYMHTSPYEILECKSHHSLESCGGVAVPLHHNIANEYTKYVCKG